MAGSVYITNRATLIFRESTIALSTGTFGGGMMITGEQLQLQLMAIE